MVLVCTPDGILMAFLSGTKIVTPHSIGSSQLHSKLLPSFFLMYTTKQIHTTIPLSITKILGIKKITDRNKLQNK